MKVVVLTGGVGGAKFVLGLQLCGLGSDLTAIVNTGDDFRHLGLHVSPDIDTLLYTLAGKANAVQGWGREGESWQFMEVLASLGGPRWFNLGDGDLALHVLRTHRLDQGDTLSAITADYARRWGIAARVLPMSNDPLRTFIETDEGTLAFQTYFVERQCQPVTRAIRFKGASQARPAPGVTEAISAADAIFIAPSNPWLSVDPVLAVPGIRSALGQADAPIIVISPLVGGQSVKGPTSKLMAELGIAATNASIADHYTGLCGGMVHDPSDAPPGTCAALATATLMTDDASKQHVARAALDFARQLA